jgi:hypothetical protein
MILFLGVQGPDEEPILKPPAANFTGRMPAV